MWEHQRDILEDKQNAFRTVPVKLSIKVNYYPCDFSITSKGFTFLSLCPSGEPVGNGKKISGQRSFLILNIDLK